MMRWLGMIGALLVLAAAGPAEVPPPGFPGRQYIDSTGCVFLRDGGGWTMRLDPGGEAVCGYPPTRLAGEDRRPLPDPADDPRLTPPGLGRVEGALLSGVLNAAQAAGPVPTRSLSGEASAASEAGGIGAQIVAGMALAPRLAAAAATPARADDSRLCELIGAPPSGAGTGARDLLGYCGAAAIATATSRPLRVGESDVGALPASDVAVTSKAGPDEELVRSESRAKHRGSAVTDRGRAGHRPAGEPRERGTVPPAATDMIPAGARYFVLSHHGDETAARDAARRLMAAGFPAAIAAPRGGGKRALMAGPFVGREAMVRALDRLRRAGYRDPVPR